MLTKASGPLVCETFILPRRCWGERRRVPAVTQKSRTHKFSMSFIARIQQLELFVSRLESWASL